MHYTDRLNSEHAVIQSLQTTNNIQTKCVGHATVKKSKIDTFRQQDEKCTTRSSTGHQLMSSMRPVRVGKALPLSLADLKPHCTQLETVMTSAQSMAAVSCWQQDCERDR